MKTSKMEGMDLVMDLIEGSAQLNWMKAKIPEVIAMILGMADPLIKSVVSVSEGGFRREIALSRECVWCLWIDHGEVIVDCWINPFSASDHKQAYSTKGEGSISMKDIETVFRGLGNFAAGMLEWFPELENRWQPLRAAAIKARENK